MAIEILTDQLGDLLLNAFTPAADGFGSYGAGSQAEYNLFSSPNLILGGMTVACAGWYVMYATNEPVLSSLAGFAAVGGVLSMAVGILTLGS